MKKIRLYKLKCFQDAVDVYDREMRKKPWIFDLSDTDNETAQRIADFIEGMAYANGGKVVRLSDTMFAVLFGGRGKDCCKKSAAKDEMALLTLSHDKEARDLPPPSACRD